MVPHTIPLASTSPEATRLAMSRRLWQTLDHLLDGCSEKEVALSLDISCHTVHSYVKRLYSLFGVETRAELMARFVVPVRGHQLRELVERAYPRTTSELIDEMFAGSGDGVAAGFNGVAGGMAFGRGWVRTLVPQGNLPKAAIPGGGAGHNRSNRPRPVLSRRRGLLCDRAMILRSGDGAASPSSGAAVAG